jgi:hypothetical protein
MAAFPFPLTASPPAAQNSSLFAAAEPQSRSGSFLRRGLFAGSRFSKSAPAGQALSIVGVVVDPLEGFSPTPKFPEIEQAQELLVH